MRLPPGYTLLESRDSDEYRSRAHFIRHASGLELLYLENDDEERAFAFAFKTPPENDRGIPHMLEHLALSGSERFPWSDAWLELSKGSLATYLNALTNPDSTIYPAASAVLADFEILFRVYADAVFRPSLQRGDFLSECVRLVPGNGAPSADGVVYNEMKGNYSSPEAVIGDAITRALFSEGHPYALDSGGKPRDIPDASIEEVRDFHRRRYHPANAKLYLYGKLDPYDLLRELAERYLAPAIELLPTAPEIPLVPRAAGPMRIAVDFHASEGADASEQAVCSWLCGEASSSEDSFDFEVLARALLGSDGAPLAKALIDAKLGELSPLCGISTFQRQMSFTVGVRGSADGLALDEAIDACLRRCMAGELDRDAVESSFHAIEISQRELHHGGSSYGLRPFFRSIRGWLHGADPFATLSFAQALDRARSGGDTVSRYASLVRTWLLENPNRVTVAARPSSQRAGERSLAGREGAALRDGEDFDRWRERAKNAGNMPRISRNDLPREPRTVPRRSFLSAGRPVLHNPIHAGGITYVDLCFPLSGSVSDSRLDNWSWMPLFARCAANSGTVSMDYAESARSLSRWTGGVSTSLVAGTALDASCRAWLCYRLKALDSELREAVGLFAELAFLPRLDDVDRLGVLATEMRNDVVSSLAYAGNAFAQTRAASAFTAAARVDEAWAGISQAAFLRSLAIFPPEALPAELTKAHAAIVHPSRAFIHITGVDRAAEQALGELGRWLSGAAPAESADFCPPLDRSPLDLLDLALPPRRKEANPPESDELFVVDSDVGYASLAAPAMGISSEAFGHASVLTHWLSNGPLWESIRGRGGAYGVACSIDPLESVVILSSSRDPDPRESLSKLAKAFDLPDGAPSEADCDVAVAGAVGKDSRPPSPEDSGAVDLRRAFFGVRESHRRLKREAQLRATAASLKEVADTLSESVRGAGRAVLLLGPHGVKSDAPFRGVEFDIR